MRGIEEIFLLVEQKKSPRGRALVDVYDAQLRFENLACGDGELLRIHAARILLDALIHQMRNGRDLTEFSLMLRQAGKDDRIGIVGKQGILDHFVDVAVELLSLDLGHFVARAIIVIRIEACGDRARAHR